MIIELFPTTALCFTCLQYIHWYLCKVPWSLQTCNLYDRSRQSFPLCWHNLPVTKLRYNINIVGTQDRIYKFSSSILPVHRLQRWCYTRQCQGTSSRSCPRCNPCYTRTGTSPSCSCSKKTIKRMTKKIA